MTYPFLVQRLNIPRSATGFPTFKFDYMGASEFEWGIVPTSLTLLMFLWLDADRAWKPQVLRAGANDLWFVGPASERETASRFVEDQMGPCQWRLLESTRMAHTVRVMNPSSVNAWLALPRECGLLPTSPRWTRVEAERAPFFITLGLPQAQSVLAALAAREVVYRAATATP